MGTNQLLGIFFLYFVLMSDYCGELLNCRLQKYMDEHILFRHLLIFLSIYIFTYILDWYSFEAINIKSLGQTDEDFEKKKIIKITEEFNMNKLWTWFLYSIFIYIIFLITTKSELTYIMFFIFYIIVGSLFQIIIKGASSKQYLKINNKTFITSKDYNDINAEKIIYIHNTISMGFFLSFSLVLFGAYKYYKRQKKRHAKKWNTIKFIFGTSFKGKECGNITA